MRAQWITSAVLALALCATTTACDDSEKETSSDDDGESRRSSKKKKKKKKKGAPTDDAWEKGSEVAVQLKLSAADVTDLACAMKKAVGKLSCAYTTPDEKASATDVRSNDTILQPFTLVDGRRVLIAGVWLMPDVKTNVAAGPGRFLATCKLIPEGKAKKAKVRTFPKAPWTDAGDQWVARARVCTVTTTAKPTASVPGPKPPAEAGARTFIPLEKYSPRLGPEHAKVTILMYTDYQ